ncbi:hypothetical protein [Mesorhizobium sp.]|uniref:hypothetical protein n=1 Tax=Mesorhizobium sp. TaxID=1871066 RepID=UPI000FEA31FE|nr:hypothetical protein [Mesorhizobium sp.]RWP81507.1 MAG: hypothetical protein EOR10_05710 [Mesorhizobium sp.]
MDRFVDVVSKSLKEKNWLSALSLSLLLPDICGRLEKSNAKSTERYIEWFDRWVGPRYTHEIGPSHQRHVFLSGADCYSLRCALSHEGRDNIEDQRARKALKDFMIVEPPPVGAGMIHCNQIDDTLQLQVDIFCTDIIAGVRNWMASVEGKAAINAGQQSSLISIKSIR